MMPVAAPKQIISASAAARRNRAMKQFHGINDSFCLSSGAVTG